MATSSNGGTGWSTPFDFNMEYDSWRDVAYGDGKFVAVGWSRIMYSSTPDVAMSWIGVNVSGMWRSIIYAGGYFVAVADNGRFGYSSDGITWNTIDYGSNDMRGLAYANGRFISTSIDGTNRVMYSSIATAKRFVAVAEDGPDSTNVVMYSDNGGVTWTESLSVLANTWVDITYGNGKWVAVASQTGDNQVMYSSDGIAWNNVAAAELNSWQAVTYGNDKFVAVSATGTNRVMYSSDGITWSVSGLSGVLENGWRGVGYGNGKFVAVGSSGTNRVMYSSDGISWTAGTTPEQNFYYDVAYGNGKYVAIARGGTNLSLIHI